MDSYPFMSIHPLIPMIELSWKLTVKIQGQSHSSRSHNRYNILSPHIPFIPCWSALPFLRCSYLKNWPWKSKVKVMGEVKVQSHNVSLTFYWSTHIPFVPCQSGIPLLSYDFFKILPWNSRVKVIDEVAVQSHNAVITSYRLTSMSIGPPILEIQHFQNLTLKIKGQGHGWGHSLSHNVGLASYRLTSLSFHVNRPSHSWDTAFSKFDLGNEGSRSLVRSPFKVTMWV